MVTRTVTEEVDQSGMTERVEYWLQKRLRPRGTHSHQGWFDLAGPFVGDEGDVTFHVTTLIPREPHKYEYRLMRRVIHQTPIGIGAVARHMSPKRVCMKRLNRWMYWEPVRGWKICERNHS